MYFIEYGNKFDIHPMLLAIQGLNVLIQIRV